MLLRGIRAHLLTSVATLVLAVVVTAGAVAVTGAGRVGHTPAAISAMLALYGAVALAEQAARATAARAHDIALARLRGTHGLRLAAFAAAPLLAVAMAGCVGGAALGVLLAGRIASGWHTSYSLGGREVLVAVAILAGAAVTVVLVSAAALRRSLVDSLSIRPRRTDPPLVARFLEILAVAAAVLAVYEARRGAHAWVAVIAPALVALAVGQVVAWLLGLTPRIGRGLGASLTTRRLRRDPDPASMVRILVAAAVLLAVTLTGARAAAVWRDDAAHLLAGGPIQVPFKAGALRAYAAAVDADPRGRWLMPVAAVDDPRPSHRRVFVASSRWQAVVGDYYADTSASDAAAALSKLTGQAQVVVLRNGPVGVRVSGFQGPPSTVVLRYLDDGGYPGRVKVAIAHDGWNRARLTGCAVGCAVQRASASGGGSFRVDRVVAGGQPVTDQPTDVAGRTSSLPVADSTSAQRALLTPGVTLDGGTVDGIDGLAQPVAPAGAVTAMPLLGSAGVLLDLGRVLIRANGSVPATQAVVVARADTPSSVLARLHADGGSTPTSYDAVLGSLRQTVQARADALAVLVAIGVALVALTHLLAWLAGQLAGRRAEVAGLRVAGVRPGAVRSAYLTEAAVLAGTVLLTSTLAAGLVMHTLLRPMRLVGGWSYAPLVDLSLRPWILAAAVLGVAAVTVVSCAFVFTRFGRGARPSALRGADR